MNLSRSLPNLPLSNRFQFRLNHRLARSYQRHCRRTCERISSARDAHRLSSRSYFHALNQTVRVGGRLVPVFPLGVSLVWIILIRVVLPDPHAPSMPMVSGVCVFSFSMKSVSA